MKGFVTVNSTVWKKRRLCKKAHSGLEEMAKYKEADRDEARKMQNVKLNFEMKLLIENMERAGPFSHT
jgi:hypothetical protein